MRKQNEEKKSITETGEVARFESRPSFRCFALGF